MAFTKFGFKCKRVILLELPEFRLCLAFAGTRGVVKRGICLGRSLAQVNKPEWKRRVAAAVIESEVRIERRAPGELVEKLVFAEDASDEAIAFVHSVAVVEIKTRLRIANLCPLKRWHAVI